MADRVNLPKTFLAVNVSPDHVSEESTASADSGMN